MDVPEIFRFPFEPYPIQVDFMKSLYKCIEQGKLGIFESPTGTGKSMSLICGTLTWLADHEHFQKSELEEKFKTLSKVVKDKDPAFKLAIDSQGEPSWFTLAKKNMAISQQQSQIKTELDRIHQREVRIKKLKQRMENMSAYTMTHVVSDIPISESKSTKSQKIDFTADEDILIEDLESNEETVVQDLNEEMVEGTKIIFASRTHSQISQFVREVKKSPFGNNIRLISLASRQQLCINEEITNQKNSTLINEKCLEMQKQGSSSTLKGDDGQTIKKSRKSSSCPFLDNKLVQLVRDLSLNEVTDVESLLLSGKKNKACPYYAARNAICDAQLVVVPYSTLLKKHTRETCGLKLQNNVVIIDEAHNLLETISSIHSISIWGHQISHAHWQLMQYQQKFHSRISAKNLLLIKQLIFFLSCLMKNLSLQKKLETNQNVCSKKVEDEDEDIYDCSKFCIEAGFDHLNLNSLVEFCEKTKLPQKLINFKSVIAEVTPVGGLKMFLGKFNSGAAQNENSPMPNPLEEVDSKEAGSSLLPVLEFMRCLINPNEDGRVLCVKKVLSSASYFKYILLNPGSLFKDFVSQARAVIVAGGTMQPSSEFQFQLFGAAGAPQNRIVTFSCDHIIPPDHVLPLVLTRGPSNKELDFSWSNRSCLLDELANLLLNINQVVSGGVVCFLPSYDFESQVVDHLKKKNYVSKIENRKKLFREPKEAKEVDRILEEYTSSIKQFSNTANVCGKNGALLLCVVGGKLSEGINFSDDLARCVVVIGLPYANIQSATLKEKMDYLNKNMMSLLPIGERRLPGQLYYESLCFKAVNQSIGRAIRHSKDYAVLVLADFRYARPSSLSSLPGWIARRLKVVESFGPSIASVSKFLAIHKRADANAQNSNS